MNTSTQGAKELANTCLQQVLSCLTLLLPSLSKQPEAITDYHDPQNPSKIRGVKEPPSTRKKKGKKYQRVDQNAP